MFSNFKIDQASTFAGIAFLSCEPKVKFGSGGVQETDKAGVSKWELQVVATFRGAFKTTSEVLKVGITSPRNPAEGLMPYTPVALNGFEVGVMEKTKKNPETGEERVIGVQVWYRCADVRALTAAGSKAA
jgi:hypothetical protein